MVDVFVKPNDEIVVNFAIAVDSKGKVYADLNYEDLKEMVSNVSAEVEKHKVVFKKPSFGDTVAMSEAIYGTADGRISFNAATDRLAKMTKLIKSWSFKDGEGNELKPTEGNIKALHPVIADFIASQLELEIGNML